VTRFGSLVRRIDDRGRGVDLPLMSVSQMLGVVRQSELTKDPPRAESLDEYKICRAGDIVFNKMSIRDGAMGVAREDGLVTYHYEVMRPQSGADPRYVVYLMKSEWFTGQLIKLERGIGTGGTSGVRTTEVPFSVLRTIDAPISESTAQGAIADYLDAETARLDGLVAARRQMLQLVSERLDGRITSILDRPDWPVVPLKWKTRVTVGIVIRPSELYVEEGIPCLRGFNVRPGAVNATDLAFISPASNALNAKSKLGTGDVVVVRTGKAGAAAVVPNWAVGGNCVDLLIIRPSGDIDPRFLEAVLNSAVVRRQIDEGSVGALQAHFNTEALANLRLPVPTREEQAWALMAIDAAHSEANAMTLVLTRQIDLLVERRRALITAAVTGQLDIPGPAA